jgi:uncharacterized protein
VKWTKGRGSDQIEDRRDGDSSGGLGGLGGGSFPIPIGKAGGGLGILGVLIALAFTFFGGGGGSGGFNLPIDINQLPGVQGAPAGGGTAAHAPATDDETQFIAFVIDDVQQAWQAIFQQAGRQYQPTRVVLFDGQTSTGCGAADSSVGPFYCPADRLVYLDAGFFRELASRFQVEGSEQAGSFAQAYVIAHEVGHHIQNLLGVSDQVNQKQQRDPGNAGEWSIRLELQADCFAGVWGHAAYGEGLVDQADIDQAIDAAQAVGDDRIQEQTTGRIDREHWTHGSSAQRAKWFRTGFDSGQTDRCDTFSVDQP